MPVAAAQPAPEPVWPIAPGKALWAHQRAALLRSSTLAAFAFQHDPGLGKTATVIAEAGRFFLDGEIDTLIIVAPNRVHLQWVKIAFPDWAGYPWKGFVWPKGGLNSQRRRDQFDATLSLSAVKPALRVFAFNYEIVRQPRGERGKRLPVPKVYAQAIRRILATSKAGVYVAYDEQHRIKDSRALQSRAAHRWFGRAAGIKVRRGLTGTPILQGVQDYWSQYAFLDPLIIDEPTFVSFRSRYCRTEAVTKAKIEKIVGPNPATYGALMARIAPYTDRVKKIDALDLPPQIFDRFVVEMEGAQARAYAQMEEIMLAGLDGGKVVAAPMVLTQLAKLLQIASGFIYDEDQKVHWLSDAKIEAIVELIDQLGGEPCVVWAPWIPLLDRLEEVLGREFGATRFRQLDDIPRWRARGGPLIANPASGGVGVDGMQLGASRAIYAANAFHLEYRLQSLDRLHRGGQERTVFYTDVLALGSKEFAVLEALARKESFDRMSVAALRRILTQPNFL